MEMTAAEYYRFGDNLFRDLDKLKTVGSVEPNGDFKFSYCANCARPELGHIAKAKDCKWDRYKDKDIKAIENELKDNCAFNITLAKFDE
jgi:hypothetical protein